MQKQLAVAIGSFFLFAALATTPISATSDEDDLVPDRLADMEFTQEELIGMGFDRWIVAFRELPGDQREYAGHPVVEVIEGLRILVVRTVEPVTLQAHAQSDENVRYVEFDDPLYGQLLYTPNDPLHNNDSGLWGTHRVGAEAAWDFTLGSSAVKIAVVDSGLNADHEEYAGQNRILNGWNFHGGNSDTSDSSSCSFHGTHVTGTLGATTDNGVGMAGLSQSTILPAKIFDAGGFFGCGAASTTNIANALMFAGDEGAHLSQNSWGGGGSSSTINDAIVYAHNLGTTHVAAAGNDGPCTNCVGQPWRDNPDIVNIVSSTTSSDGFSSFSSQGPEVTVAAPGSGIKSTTSGTSGYGTLSGTSMAAPHVSGSLALYIDDNGDVGFNELRSVLTSTAEDLGHSQDRQGAGLVRADLMLEAGGGDPGDPDPVGPTASFTHTCTDLDCSFDASGSVAGDAPISSYDWDFGDGNTGSGETTSHSYASEGTYTVTLTVTDSDSLTDSASESISVQETPEGVLFAEDFSGGSAPGWQKSSMSNDLWRVADDCVDAVVASHQLVFSRAAPDCDYDVGHAEGWIRSPAVDASGQDTVELSFSHFYEVESFNGEYDIMRVQVSSDGTNWATLDQWDARDATNGAHEQVTYDISAYASSDLQVRFYFDTVDSVSNDFLGWYVDDVVITAEGGSDPDPDPEGPTASFTHTCTDLDCSFDASGSTAGDAPISSYDWDFGDGNTGTGETASHSYASEGTYTVTLTVTDGNGLSDSDSASVLVTEPEPEGPVASFTHTCTDLDCSFDASGSTAGDAPISSYDWDFGDGNTGTGETASHSYASEGTYTVTLTVTDGNGLSDSDSASVSVEEPPGDTVLYAEDFSDGTASGWHKSSMSNDLWRLANDCVTPAVPTHQLAFSRAAPACDYDVGHAEGWARSPIVDASGYSSVVLSFSHFFEVESWTGEVDIMRVQVSSNGGSSWSTIAQWDARDGTNGGYQEVSFDVSAHATSDLRLRFYFDSVDSIANDYPGWFIDDIVVTGS